MATLTNTSERAASIDQPGFRVVIELVWDTSESPIAIVDSLEMTIKGSFTTTADLDGEWTIEDIVSNNLITPADSAYRITETYGDGNISTYYVQLTSDSDFWIGDVLVSEPDYVS